MTRASDFGARAGDSAPFEAQSEAPFDVAVEARRLGIPGRLAVVLLDAYKRWLSPYLPRSCRFTPTCSEYSRLAVLEYGLLRGILLTTWRLARCHPLSAGGVDLP